MMETVECSNCPTKLKEDEVQFFNKDEEPLCEDCMDFKDAEFDMEKDRRAGL